MPRMRATGAARSGTAARGVDAGARDPGALGRRGASVTVERGDAQRDRPARLDRARRGERERAHRRVLAGVVGWLGVEALVDEEQHVVPLLQLDLADALRG